MATRAKVRKVVRVTGVTVADVEPQRESPCDNRRGDYTAHSEVVVAVLDNRRRRERFYLRSSVYQRSPAVPDFIFIFQRARPRRRTGTVSFGPTEFKNTS